MPIPFPLIIQPRRVISQCHQRTLLRGLLFVCGFAQRWYAIAIPLQPSIASLSPSTLQLFVTTFIPSSLHLLLEASSDSSLNGITAGQLTPRCAITLTYCALLCAVCVSAQPCFHVSFMCPHPEHYFHMLKKCSKEGAFHHRKYMLHMIPMQSSCFFNQQKKNQGCSKPFTFHVYLGLRAVVGMGSSRFVNPPREQPFD